MAGTGRGACLLLVTLGGVDAVEVGEHDVSVGGVVVLGRGVVHDGIDDGLLERVVLTERLAFRPDQLSGGEKQRVAVARALANNPTVPLADEPTANLDSGHGREVARLLRRLAEKDRRSIVIVSHDDRLRQVADRVLWLEDGTFHGLTAMATDPVCGMAVEPTGNPHHDPRRSHVVVLFHPRPRRVHRRARPVPCPAHCPVTVHTGLRRPRAHRANPAHRRDRGRQGPTRYGRR